MRDRIRINAELLHFFARPAVVLRGRGGGEKKFRFALGAVLFHGKDHRGPNQNAVLARFSDNNRTLFDPETLTQFFGTTIAPRFPTFADSMGASKCPYFRMPDIRANVKLGGIAA